MCAARTATGPASTGPASPAVENYLKVIFALGERDTGPVNLSRVAERVGVSASSASGMIRRLTELGLVEHERYSTIHLTEAGTRAALQVVRRHRLLEMFLVAQLDMSWDEVHDEAEVLEHAVSDRLIDRIDALLGHPTRDPHGDPIPTAAGHIEVVRARRLTSLAAGEAGPLVRVDDLDPAVLRELDNLDIALGQRVQLVERLPFDGPYVALVGGAEHRLAPLLAHALWIG